MEGAPKPKKPKVLHGRSTQTQSIARAPTLCSSDDISMRGPHCEVMLSGRTNHTRVKNIRFFVPNWICLVGVVIWQFPNIGVIKQSNHTPGSIHFKTTFMCPRSIAGVSSNKALLGYLTKLLHLHLCALVL